MNKREIGSCYEKRAAELLEREEYKIRAKNYHGRVGELDLIAEKDGTIIFVEVKYRRDEEYGYGSESIDRKKMQRMYKTAKKYLALEGLQDRIIRFDMIIFTGEKYLWEKNIFWGDEIWR